MFKTGEARINAALGVFEGIRRDLLKGVEELEDQIQDNLFAINELEGQNRTLTYSRGRADRALEAVSKLSGLIG